MMHRGLLSVSVSVSVSISVILSFCHSVILSFCLCPCLYVSMSLCLSVSLSLSLSLSFCLSIILSFCLSSCVSVFLCFSHTVSRCVPVCLSVCLSVPVSVALCAAVRLMSFASMVVASFMSAPDADIPVQVAAAIAAGADVNASNALGFPALYRACLMRHEPVIDLLLEAGADADAGIGSGANTATVLAGSGDDPALLAKLVARGASLTAPLTALRSAVMCGNPQTVEYVLAHPSASASIGPHLLDINAEQIGIADEEGTPEEQAAHRIVKELLEAAGVKRDGRK